MIPPTPVIALPCKHSKGGAKSEVEGTANGRDVGMRVYVSKALACTFGKWHPGCFGWKRSPLR